MKWTTPRGPDGLNRTVRCHITATNPGLLFTEVSSLTGVNVLDPFLLAARHILPRIDSGDIDPEASGTGISYGERQLRTVGSVSRLGGWKRKRTTSVSITDLVERKKCNC